MTEVKTKSDKPNAPAYSGGEDEGRTTKKPQSAQQSNELPVDESDDGPAAAAEDTAEDD
jgi:hypothetical protein